MVYYNCVRLYLIKMVAIYMQMKCDSASWQFISTTLSTANHLCPYLRSPGPIWGHFSKGRPNSTLRDCKFLQVRYMSRVSQHSYKPLLIGLFIVLVHSCSSFLL